MASAIGLIAGKGSSSSWLQVKEKGKKKKTVNRVRVSCSSSVMDPYKTLRIQPGASESEVRKAFRKLALQYHPDVCKGSNCGVQFHTINEAYDIVMSNLRKGESNDSQMSQAHKYDVEIDEPMRGMHEDWDLWEEWMGWEGAGIRDYSSHINPYI
ncbi:hypothetical protein CCACVL1_10062 [Corchorus capsularis]|uniref:J domain-containing protein n=1 Tax=Corchorus capsularis TaxID=210143 RepID=A0A1R3ISU5_COCAP|nr:hypothetical protein CCACVL1_10062 [Corchorus capsularis]